ncbi:glycosyltransferase [Solidesulfovibrio magneticus]|uniref:Glycosyltransferase n=1 Tax=Solidesulfovibrio magneticus (strain ATCC 700980 / DSM 13731 / RS-1) TaxID=573370 RepID=C4XU90_SOLM1|nr:glycosyltransferase [Solidesulfovibrio magneticus]BAH76112.1 putative glycosyltransferase [Solidesulfovibrio magneticus RS-1]
MRITIDASSLSYPKRTGIGRCLESVLPHLASLAQARGDSLTLISGQPVVNAAALALIEAGAVRAATVNVPSLYAWQQAGMAWQTKEVGSDVHYAPDGLLPVGFTGRSLGVVNDVLWKRIPETLPRHIRWVFALRQRASLENLTIPLSLSAFTRAEALALYGEAAARIRPTSLCAVDHHRFRPAQPADTGDAGDIASLADFRARHGLPEAFFLCVGNLMAHKNLTVALRAMARLPEDAVLAVVGHGDPGALSVAALAASLSPGRVRCLGYLPDDDLPLAYRAAAAFVFPSRYEGFGLPLLEAMASGTPVAYAEAASLPEAAGGAGLPFAPDDDAALASILTRLMADLDLRREQIALGLARAAAFSWQDCAQNVFDALIEAAGESDKRPKVTIVTPSYNQAVYLEQTLTSVAGQQNVAVEHIVLDGGSTDATPDILLAWDGRLAFSRSAKDDGQTAALAEGFARATGEVLGWLNSDDWLWSDDALRAVAEAFAKHPDAVMVTGDTVLTDAEGKPVMIDMVLPSSRQMRYTMAVPQQSTFFRKSAYEAAGGMDTTFSYCMDFDLFERISRQGRIVRLPKVLAAFRLHPSAKTATWQEVFRRDVAACQHRHGSGFLHELKIKLVTLEVRLGSVLAQLGAIAKGRPLPSHVNCRLEPLRAYARKKHGLAG